MSTAIPVSISATSRNLTPALPAEPRSDARVTFPDGRVFSAPVDTTLESYVLTAFPPEQPHPDGLVVGAVVDNRLCELTLPVLRDCAIIPVTLRSSDGSRIYRRSLAFLLVTAVSECFPGVKIAVQHDVPTGGMYCELQNRANFNAAELAQIAERMREIVAEDAPIIRQTLPLSDAVEHFRSNGDDDMVRLLENRGKDYLTVYALRGVIDYFFGYMVPSARYLYLFDLALAGKGFVLANPRQETPQVLRPYKESRRLEAVFRQSDEWLTLMGLEDVGRLNQSIAAGRIREEVLLAEALHSRRMEEMAREIAMRHTKGARLVLLSGPSSAGKTTTSKRLAVQLMAYGIQPFALAMDDYFIDRDLTPRDEHGDYDFESLYALNLERFNRDLLGLMSGTEVALPRYDFKLGKSVEAGSVHLTSDHITIIEGIHGLNPELVSQIKPERLFRIYVSALTVLNLNRHNRIPTTDVRLLRRMVRDAATRGYSAQDTLDRWSSVRRGEERYIFPYQENADFMFNSSLFYELAVLRPYAEPLLRQVDIDSVRYIEAKRLLAFLSWVRPADPEFVPNDSLLREFIGGSVMETYTPGR
ncbi:MAG: nucleoside kinase [Anaerolineae bacterium]|nr:nucleoside kinase [Anaerolineae bacterium]